MIAFSHLSIKRKLIAIISVISLVCLFVASLTFVVYDRYTVRQRMVQEVKVLGQIIADRSTAAVVFFDKKLATENLNSLAARSSIMSACIKENNQGVFATYSREQKNAAQGEKIPVACFGKEEGFKEQFTSQYLDLIEPIILDGSTIGTLHIRSDLHEMSKRLNAYLVVMVLIMLVGSFIVAILSVRLQRIVSDPLLELTKTAEIITQKQDYSLRAYSSSGSRDEVSVLVKSFNSMLTTIEEQNLQLIRAKETLETQVERRTAELRNTNQELEAFSYSVSHDLRAPLRSIDGFSAALEEDYSPQFDNTGKDYLRRIRTASQRMGSLIDDLLHLSKVSRKEMIHKPVDLAEIASEVIQELEKVEPQRKVYVDIPEYIDAYGDRDLLRIVMENLLSNAWKYTSKTEDPRIELGTLQEMGKTVFYVKDNGAGFDMNFADKLFGAFQRLHRDDEFEGVGIGLATVARIIHRHGGRIWAEAEVARGATFYFTLPVV